MAVEIDSAALDRLLNDPAGPVGQDLERRAIAVESMAKRLASEPGSGYVYTTRFFRRGGKLYKIGTRPPHQASAPGEPFASDTGRLRNSISHQVTVGPSGLYAEVGSNVNYMLWVELGTRYMEPRPTLRPALAAAAG